MTYYWWILLFLSSCISLPKDEKEENLLSAPSVDATIQESIESGFFSVGNWPEENWWEVFQCPELDNLISDALSQNPTIRSIEHRVEMARQSAKVVKSRLFPLLFFDVNESWEYLSKHGLYRAFNPKLPLNANLIDLTLSFTYEFDFWGKNRNLFNAALGEHKAQEAEAAEVKLITTTSVAQAYFALKTNLVRKQLFEALYTVRKDLFNLQSLLRDEALLSELQPLLSEESLLESEKLLWSIEQEVETNQHLLNILIGAGPDNPLAVAAERPAPLDTVSIPETISLDLLSRRPDLMAQIWRVEALAHQVGAAKADFYPNINLTAFGGLESILYRFLFNSESKTGGLQPAIHLPIFTAGEIRANIRTKKASFDEAVFAYNELLLKSASEVADLLVFAKATFQQKADQELIVDAAQTRYDITALRHLSGLDNLLSQYAIQEEVILKELDNVSLLYTQYLAAIKLIKALGGGYQSEYGLPLTARGDNDN